MRKEWYATWFDSPYYHLLYKDHDEQEARRALDGLLRALDLAEGARVLDLGCGKGRHARYLAEKGFDVTGLDIAASSITFARHFEHERLSFYQHDMRLPFRINYFDAVLNFFTSFGYFDREDDHQKTLQNVALNLKPGGLFLIDFFNSEWVRRQLVRREEKTIDGIRFEIRKHIRSGYVFKTVRFSTGGRTFIFRERVRLFTLADFDRLLAGAGMARVRLYGDYDLSTFDPDQSRRLILIARKP